MAAAQRRRDQRLELRTTAEEREIINEAVRAAGTDLTAFAVSSLLDASRRVLADRTTFVMDEAAARAWEEINDAPAEQLPGLLSLMARKSPFVE